MLSLPLTLYKIFVPVPNVHFRLLSLFFAICLNACDQRSKSMSFYYWRKVYAPDTAEVNTLKENKVHTLYVHYFDVDWPDTVDGPILGSPVRFDSVPTGYYIVPVVFFSNKVFEKADSVALADLTNKVLHLVALTNHAAQFEPEEIQFDCDWTEKGKDNYFRFLRQYQAASGLVISSTIRLYQIKFADRIGIPPVDHGVLIFYNMDSAEAATGNPIYERASAHRYTPSLRSYPLTLDLALPIIRSASTDDLLEIVDDVNRHSNHRIRNLIFFDLDRQNLLQYDKGLFQEMLERTN
jgi:hypothetical protein